MTPQKLRLPLVVSVIASLVMSVFAQNRSDTFRPTVRGVRGVVAGGHPLVAEAGLRMLHRGGNAVDAGVAATLAGHGLHLHDLVKVHVWLRDIEDLRAMEQAFAGRFPEGGYPARMTATTRFVDTDCLVMIEGTAYRAD